MKLEEALILLLQNKVLATEDDRLWQACGVTGGDSYVSFDSYLPAEDYWTEEANFPKEGWRLATPEEEASL